MLKAVIVEDEPRSRQLLEELVTNSGKNIVVVATADSVATGYIAILEHKPDLVFLDIEMHSETGFDLLEKFREIDFEIIFTTAYEHYALKAIKFCAIDYLLKPIDITDLKTAIDKVDKRKSKDNVNKNIEVLLNNIKSKSNESHQIALPTSDGLIFVHVRDIIYCESDGPYTTFNLKRPEKIVTSKNLKEYEELLEEHKFFRIHKSYLVNLREIKKYYRGEGGQVLMTNGATIEVSKRKKESFLNSLSQL